MSAFYRRYKIAKFVTLATALVFVFQACGETLKFGSIDTKSAMADSGNGGSYGGKLGTYVYHDPAQPCELAQDGKPLPNAQIKLLSLSSAELVRSDCLDIPPQTLTSADFQTSANGIAYQGKDFIYRAPQTEFQIVAASCPASYTPIANAARTNLLQSSQSLLEPDWAVMAGVTSVLDGTLAGLDGFRITRTNTSSFQRLRQTVTLFAGHTYSLSVLARPGSGNSMRLEFEQGTGGDFSASFDLVSGGMTLNGNNGFSQITSASQQISNAQFVTLYFTPNVNMTGDVGITTTQVVVGDSIYATAAQLEDVSTFCAP